MRNKTIKMIAVNAMFFALLILMTFVPYIGYITVGPISFTTMHIVVLIGALFYGYKEGALLGFVFGLLSLIKAISYPSTLDYIFVNPFVSVLPRVLFGLISGLVFSLLKKRMKPLHYKIILYPVCGLLTFLHTVLVILCLYVFGILDVFKISSLLGLKQIIDGINNAYGNFWSFLFGFLAIGTVFEIVISVIAVPTFYLFRYNKESVIKSNENKKEGHDMDFKKLVKNYEDEATKTLQKLIQINSVYDESTVTREHPYGLGVHNAFEFLGKLAKNDGFDVDYCDGHCIEISCGEGEHVVGVFAHIDVVPVSGVWKFPPFSGEISENVMYGRGTSDDKGPAMAAYYALKALNDNKLIKGYKVKLVLGGDEERGSSCLQYYFEQLKKPAVTYGFTPDGDFPLIYGEKGIRDFTYDGEIDLSPAISFNGGVAPNAVIDDAVLLTGRGKEFKKYLKTRKDVNYKILEEKDDTITVEFIGKSAHGSTPEKGINAGIHLLDCLGKCFGSEEINRFVRVYKDGTGKTMHQYYETKYLGGTTYNLGMMDYKNKHFVGVINFRYPENVDSDHVISAIASQSSIPVFAVEKEAPVVYYDPTKTPFILALYDAYVRETGDAVNKPMAIGGGTYAKEAKNTVAFGSHFPGKEDLIHSADEHIDMEDFLGSIPLYADAIDTLGKLK